MTRLGSEKNPLILRVKTKSRMIEVTKICAENEWHYIVGIEPDENEDIADLERKLTPPVKNEFAKIGRNEPCWCNSGKKYKRCCGAGA